MAKKPPAETPRPPGRPTKCTPETVAQIVETIRGGNWAKVAARQAGISEATYHSWMADGELGREPYAAFSESVKAAQAEAEIELVRDARLGQTGGPNSTGPHWSSAMTILERLYPDRWGKRDPHRGELAELEKRCKQLEIETAEAKLKLLHAGIDPDSSQAITVIVPTYGDG